MGRAAQSDRRGEARECHGVERGKGEAAACLKPDFQLAAVDPVAWDGKEIPERPWLVRDLIPMQNTTLISGHGGTGKSTLVLDLLVCASLGLPWLGLETKRVNCVGFFAEDDRDELQPRLGSILRHHGREFADLEALTLLDRVDQPNMLMQWENKWQPGQPASLFTRLSNTIEKTGAQLLVIDSAVDRRGCVKWSISSCFFLCCGFGVFRFRSRNPPGVCTNAV
jgi:RecA-family ATPase